MSNKLNKVFKAGKLSILMDGTFGSSGKGKMASFIAENSDNWTFACNTFAPQAGHWVRLKNGKSYFYQTLNSCAYLHDKIEKIYIGPGGMIELPAFFREVEENNIPLSKIGISPCAAVLQSIDSAYERGEVDLDGNTLPARGDGTLLKGSTAHGVGAATARKILRRKDAMYAKDVSGLKECICNVPEEIIARLSNGESGFGEIAQGFPLSLNHEYFLGYTTSRNVTVSQFMSDMFLPPVYAGSVIVNFRTLPIRINSNKYISESGKFLTWEEVKSGVPHTVIKGNSGHWYPDQTELTWEEVTSLSGSKIPIEEITSVTKLPRKVATFSRQCLREACAYNDAGNGMFVTVNFMNYVDSSSCGVTEFRNLSEKCKMWVENKINNELIMMRFSGKITSVPQLLLIGTGPNTEDTVIV